MDSGNHIPKSSVIYQLLATSSGLIAIYQISEIYLWFIVIKTLVLVQIYNAYFFNNSMKQYSFKSPKRRF